MTAQAIEGVIQPSINVINNNETSSLLSNKSDLFIINEKISIGTTLALLVGLVQVNLMNILIFFY
jgi:hypothetical protein